MPPTTKYAPPRPAKTRGPKQEKIIDNPSLIIVDLFCGAGGTSTGFHLSGIAKVIACVNHDHQAIISHWQNYPRVRHFNEDMRKLDLTELMDLVAHYRRLYPNAKLVLWASLECTNFSKAKGGMARDADSRTLADHLHRYITALCPDYIQIENVVEFKTWGPMRIKAKALHLDRCDLNIQKKKKVGKKKKQKLGQGTEPVIEYPHCRLSPGEGSDADWNYGWIPIPETKGQDYRRWCAEVEAHGYVGEWRELNSADFGAYTSRNRLFGLFSLPGLNKIWPEKTHSKKKVKGLKNWKAVKDVLDFSNEGYSIFNRGRNMSIPPRQRKDLTENTLARVYMGCIKHIAGGKDKFIAKTYAVSSHHHGTYDTNGPSHTLTTRGVQQLVQPHFISKYHNGEVESRHSSINDPLGVIDTQNRHAIVSAKFIVQRNSGNPESKVVDVNGPARTLTATGGNQDVVQGSFISKYFSGVPYNKNISVNGPAGTIKTVDGQALVQAQFISTYHGNGHNTTSVDSPSPTIPTKDSVAIVSAAFLDKSYSGSANHQSVEVPAGVIMPNDKYSLVTPAFIDRQFSNGGRNSSLDKPAGSITSVPKMNIVSTESFIDTTNFSNVPRSIEDPAGTITADRHYPYLFKLCYGGQVYSVESPAGVLIAGEDKDPTYLVVTEFGELAIEVYEDDSPYTKKLKEFMAMYGIVDIKMRMLVIMELLKIQGFPFNYRLSGTQGEQKKFIGNSVVPHVVKAWALAIHYDLMECFLKAA